MRPSAAQRQPEPVGVVSESVKLRGDPVPPLQIQVHVQAVGTGKAVVGAQAEVIRVVVVRSNVLVILHLARLIWLRDKRQKPLGRRIDPARRYAVSGKRQSGGRIDDCYRLAHHRLRKVAGALLGSGQRAHLVIGQTGPRPEVAEEDKGAARMKQLRNDKGSAADKTEAALRIRRFCDRLTRQRKGPRVECRVIQVEEGGAPETVAAAACAVAKRAIVEWAASSGSLPEPATAPEAAAAKTSSSHAAAAEASSPARAPKTAAASHA